MSTVVELAARVRRAVETVRRWVERTVLWRVWERLLEIEFIDRSVALAAKAFVALLPLLIVAAAFTPTAVRSSILSTLSNRLGVRGDSLDLIRNAFASPETTRSSTGLVGLALVLLYATSFTTALQRVYLRAWRRPPVGGAANKARGMIWLAGVIALLSVLGALRRVAGGTPGTAVYLVLAPCAAVGAWWATSWLLLKGLVRWRPLLPGALLAGVATSAYSASAAVWMPRTLRQNELQFGFIGVALSFVTWFVGLAFILVAAAAAGAVAAEDPGRLGRLVRGPNRSVLTSTSTRSPKVPEVAPQDEAGDANPG